jgi:rhodanese-related sulfurtransferase
MIQRRSDLIENNYNEEEIIKILKMYLITQSIPLNQINSHLAEIPKDKSFILMCAGGYRSMIAASILKQRGWENFKDVIGGFAEVKKTNVPKTDYICPTTLL